MILTVFAAALAAPNMPRSSTFIGPGTYCGSYFFVFLKDGDHVTDYSLPEGEDIYLTIAGRKINAAVGPHVDNSNAQIVSSFSRGSIRQYQQYGHTTYLIDLPSPTVGLHSENFQGFDRDAWFFDRVHFTPLADEPASCLKPVNARHGR